MNANINADIVVIACSFRLRSLPSPDRSGTLENTVVCRTRTCELSASHPHHSFLHLCMTLKCSDGLQHAIVIVSKKCMLLGKKRSLNLLKKCFIFMLCLSCWNSSFVISTLLWVLKLQKFENTEQRILVWTVMWQEAWVQGSLCPLVIFDTFTISLELYGLSVHSPAVHYNIIWLALSEGSRRVSVLWGPSAPVSDLSLRQGFCTKMEMLLKTGGPHSSIHLEPTE